MVNLASRFCDAGKEFKSSPLFSEEVKARLSEEVRANLIENVSLKGKEKDINLHYRD